MRIFEFLQRKYKQNPGLISEHEAGAFGIPFPITKGWLNRHGDREITQYMRHKLGPGANAGPLVNSHRAEKNNRIANGSLKIIKSSGKINREGDDFYLSPAWRKLRMSVLVRYGAVCQCCGSSPKNGSIMHVDHIKPRSKFPSLELDFNNLQVLCEACNLGKSNIDQTDWR